MHSAIDLVEPQLSLFSTAKLVVVEFKARRKVAPRCPECGRRGYCVRVCRRRSLLDAGAGLVDELALRWVYLARLEFSQRTVRLPDVSRGAPTKGLRMR